MALAFASLTAHAGLSRAADDGLGRYDGKIKPEDRTHWAFVPVRRPEVPRVKDAAWVRNPIDAFVLARLEERGWRPAGPAPPVALLRRLWFDVVGLPPTPEAIDALGEHPTAETLDRVVDVLLARPEFGERWGRHWLDVVRYADTNGYERDAVKPNVWRYRDYVIRAMNEDKPYDRFLAEQLAGDEVPGSDAETMIGAGFLRLGPWDDEPADPKQDRFDQLDDIVGAVGDVFLGLTLSCARCHDHKFEPLTQADYYRMVAVFDPLERPRDGRAERDVPIGTPSELAADAERGQRIAALREQLDALHQLAPRDVDSAGAIEEQLRWLQTTGPDLPRGYLWAEPAAPAPETRLLHRGQATAPGPRVPPGIPAVLTASQPAFRPEPGAHTTQRRLQVARWLTRPDHPLAARVIVNRVWQYHFGEGLVRTPNDFGVMGDPPTHPELLDWLASWLVDQGWSLKRLHRLILTSNTYRMSKRWNPSYGAEDPEDRLLWRVPYRRLEAEAIRDAILASSGRLVTTMYGPAVYPEVPAAAIEAHPDRFRVWQPFDEAKASRRTVYAITKRSLAVPMLEVLDLCDSTRSASRRNVTSVAPQALTMLNGEFVNRQARHLADRVAREAGPDRSRQIDRVFRLTLSRPPTAAEAAALLRFLEEEGAEIGGAGREQAALARLCRLVFNMNEFVYTD